MFSNFMISFHLQNGGTQGPSTGKVAWKHTHSHYNEHRWVHFHIWQNHKLLIMAVIIQYKQQSSIQPQGR